MHGANWGKGLSFNLDEEIGKWRARTGNQSPRMLNLGAGDAKMAGWTNVDQRTSDDIQIVHDLNTFPYPLAKESYDIIYMSHVLEHLDRPLKVLDELHRILRPGGMAIIRVPHYAGNSNWIDITHRRPYSVLTLNQLADAEHCRLYGMKQFRAVRARLGFWKFWFYPWNYLMEPLAKAKPVYYEAAIANIFPPFEVIFFLEK